MTVTICTWLTTLVAVTVFTSVTNCVTGIVAVTFFTLVTSSVTAIVDVTVLRSVTSWVTANVAVTVSRFIIVCVIVIGDTTVLVTKISGTVIATVSKRVRCSAVAALGPISKATKPGILGYLR